MKEMQPRCVIAGNWKMYKTVPEATAFIEALIPQIQDVTHKIYLAVPFTAIGEAAKLAAGSNLIIGAQNMNDASEGAFTGEIAAKMLKDAGAQFVVLGHSERRRLFGESSEFINKKVKRALSEGLEPLVCVGETLEEHERGSRDQVLEEMVCASLHGLTADEASRVVLAYEPVWAIGTGKTATPAQAQEAHRACRQVVDNQWGAEVSQVMPILYGGSVTPESATELMDGTDVNGLLVGGASLDAVRFNQIVHFR